MFGMAKPSSASRSATRTALRTLGVAEAGLSDKTVSDLILNTRRDLGRNGAPVDTEEARDMAKEGHRF